MADELLGTVLKSTGSWYSVMLEDGREIPCRIRGKFRMEGLRSTNPLAVGDRVSVELSTEDGQDIGLVTYIEDRKNYIVRKSVNLSKRAHIIAANIDQAILVVTMKAPKTLPVFIDRFAVTAEAYNIPLIIVFNKIDIYGDKEWEECQMLEEAYEIAGYETIRTSAVTGEGLDKLKAAMTGEVSLISGNSGVGKSTLINALEPTLNLKTTHISEQHKTGQHTTTFAEMHPLSFGGYIIDTPGIKGFGLIDIGKEELGNYFPEMHALLPDCKFYNCQHVNEPKCAVKEAVADGRIAESRYLSYLQMYEKNDEEEVYR